MNKRNSKRPPLMNWGTAVLAFLLLLGTMGYLTSSVVGKYKTSIGATGVIGSADFDFSYMMRDPYNINSAAEFYEAVQYGYSYIKLVDLDEDHDGAALDDNGTNNSYVFANELKLNVNQPMTIDLNGQTLTRMGQEALLSVSPGVVLTIIDSSEAQNGGFYNPVGSVLEVNGGQLLVQAGKFESGPRYWEYYTYEENGSFPNQRVDTDTMVDSYPVINYPTSTGTYINGNIYFDQAVGSIPADTYCYYICSGMDNDATLDTAAASFHYAYFIDSSSKAYRDEIDVENEKDGALTPTPDGCLRVDIYGFENDISTANPAAVAMADGDPVNTPTIPCYAAVSMKSGSLVVNTPAADYSAVTRDENNSIIGVPDEQLPRALGTGCFVSYWGVDNTACIYMLGGTMNVEQAGMFTAVNPDLFPLETNLAKNGRSYCIWSPPGSTGKLYIGDNEHKTNLGVYRSYNASVIRVEDGTLEAAGGTYDMLSNFTTDVTGRSSVYVSLTNPELTCKVNNAQFRVVSKNQDCLVNVPLQTRPYIGENTYAVYVETGNLAVTNSSFEIHGSYTTGVYAKSGTTTFTGVSMTMDGADGLYGIASFGGNVTINNSATDMPWRIGHATVDALKGDNSTAIYADGAAIPEVDSRVQLTALQLDMYGDDCCIAYALDYAVNSGSSKYTLYGTNCIALEAVTSDSFTAKRVSFSTSSITAEGNGSYGIVAHNGLVVSISTPMTFKGDNSYAIQVFTGTVVLGGNVDVTMAGNKSVGIDVTEGSVDSAQVKYIFTGSDSTALRVNNGSIKIYDEAAVTMNGDNSTGISANAGEVISEGVTYTFGSDADGADGSVALLLNGGTIKISKQIHDGIETLTSITMYGAGCKGIKAQDGTIHSVDVTYELTGVNAHGIEANAGNIACLRNTFTLPNPDNCYGIFALGKDTDASLRINLVDSQIYVGHNGSEWKEGNRTQTDNGNVKASMGVFLAGRSGHDDYLSLTGCELYSIDIGIGVRDGFLFLQGGNTLESQNASVLAVTGGSVFLGNLDEVYRSTVQLTDNDECDLVRIAPPATTDESGTATAVPSFMDLSAAQRLAHISEAEGATITMKSYAGEETKNTETGGNVSDIKADTGTNEYWTVDSSYKPVWHSYPNKVVQKTSLKEKNFCSPEILADGSISAKAFGFDDGVYVNGGNLNIITRADITFTGYCNKAQTTGDFAKIYENSFALHVVNGNAILRKGSVTNSCGGGVCVSGGDLTLGETGMSRTDLVITTTGSDHSTDTLYNPSLVASNSTITEYLYSWPVPHNFTGGSGVLVSGGDLTVYNGTITTKFGNAMTVFGDKQNSPSKVTVYNGFFKGATQKMGNESQSGPGSCYGLKVLGASDVTIWDGTFGGGNGGAYVGGAISSSQIFTAKVRVYKGKFGNIEDSDSDYDLSNVGAHDAFNVYDSVDIVMGAYTDNQTLGTDVAAYQNAIQVIGKYTGFAVNSVFNVDSIVTGHATYVRIYYGTYKGSTSAAFDSISPGEGGKIQVYNAKNDEDDTGTTYSGYMVKYCHVNDDEKNVVDWPHQESGTGSAAYWNGKTYGTNGNDGSAW